jgi:hypothetical protein
METEIQELQVVDQSDMGREYLKAIYKEIEFFDISHLDDSDTSIEDQLAAEFKEKLLELNVAFMFNENDEVFIPLRPYFATALRHAIENIDPNDYPKYVKLKKEIGSGLDTVYFNEIILPPIADKVFDKFFVDFSHPLLYNSKDGRDDYSFTGMHGKYGFLMYSVLVDETAGVKPFYTKEEFAKVVGTDGENTYKEPWTHSYNDRFPIIFSKLTTEYCKTRFYSLDD